MRRSESDINITKSDGDNQSEDQTPLVDQWDVFKQTTNKNGGIDIRKHVAIVGRPLNKETSNSEN